MLLYTHIRKRIESFHISPVLVSKQSIVALVEIQVMKRWVEYSDVFSCWKKRDVGRHGKVQFSSL